MAFRCACTSDAGVTLSDLLRRINLDEDRAQLGIWKNLRRGLHPRLNIFLCRTILCFIADMMYMTCIDGAPMLTSLAREMHDALDAIVVPTLREKRPDLATEVTWGYCWRAAVCLRDVFKKVHTHGIDAKSFKPLLDMLCPVKGTSPQ